MSIALFALSLLLQLAEPGQTPPQGSPPDPAVSPAMAAARANRPLVRTPPRFVEQPEYVRSDAAVETGAFGEVLILGIVGTDGRMTEPNIVRSSRSMLIDNAALELVPQMRFEPARDEAGAAMAVPIQTALEFGHVDFRGPRGLPEYRCSQFVRDYDWWRRTWPADHYDRIYLTLRGYVALAALQSAADTRQALSGGADFDRQWAAAIEACRSTPDARMIDGLPRRSTLRELILGVANR